MAGRRQGDQKEAVAPLQEEGLRGGGDFCLCRLHCEEDGRPVP